MKIKDALLRAQETAAPRWANDDRTGGIAMNATSSAQTNQSLVLSGILELAVGALTGWPYALAVNSPDRIGALGIQSVPRLRQWHLDLIALGGLSVLVGSAVPDLPRRVAWPLAAGAWTNAHAFGVLAFRPAWKDSPAYQAAVAGSFAAVTWGYAGLAVLATKRWRER